MDLPTAVFASLLITCLLAQAIFWLLVLADAVRRGGRTW